MPPTAASPIPGPDGPPVAPRAIAQVPFTLPAGHCEVVLVRHGASEAAVEGADFPVVDGQGDPALSDAGLVQAELVGRRLAVEVPHAAALYVTNLCRTAQTAAPFALAVGLEPVVERDLREVHLGEWERGLFRFKVASGDPIALRMMAEERWDVIPGAEAAAVFSARIAGALARIGAAHPDRTVVVVSHGGTIAEACRQATGSRPFAFAGPENAGVSRLLVRPDGTLRLRSFNDTAHLAQAHTG